MNRATNKEIEEIKNYWETFTQKGYRSPGFNIQDNYTIYYPNFIEKYLQPSKEKILFEIGCGWGKQTKLFAPMFNKVIASDISKTILSIAQQRCSEEKNIIYCEYPNDLEKISLHFDCLFSYGTLQYCKDEIVITMLEDITALMKSNGRFLLEFQMFDSIRVNQKEIDRENGRSDIMRNPHEVKSLLDNTNLVMEGYALVLEPALQVWTYGYKK